MATKTTTTTTKRDVYAYANNIYANDHTRRGFNQAVDAEFKAAQIAAAKTTQTDAARRRYDMARERTKGLWKYTDRRATGYSIKVMGVLSNARFRTLADLADSYTVDNRRGFVRFNFVLDGRQGGNR